MKSILIIDDEIEICESIKMILEYEDYHVEFATNPSEGLDKIRSSKYEVILLDINMPELNGFEVLQKVTNDDIDINVIMISAHSSVENAVKATKLGAFDFIEKPIDRDKLLITVRNAVNQNELKKENKELKNSIEDENIIIGESESLKRVLETAKRVAVTESRILITGENGTGKELIAKEIHKFSKRKDKPFIEVNCAAIPNELIESELFGHEKGAFTDARYARVGCFEAATGGTVFLDEVGEIPVNLQAKLLRAVQEKEITRLGSNQARKIDVRIIAATNRNLEEMVVRESFREDLFYRLSVFKIFVPPLRERRGDINAISQDLLRRLAIELNRGCFELSEVAVDALCQLEWPGNIRELKNCLERAVVMADSRIIEPAHLGLCAQYVLAGTQEGRQVVFPEQAGLDAALESFERNLIREALANNENVKSRAAEELKIPRTRLLYRMKKLGLDSH